MAVKYLSLADYLLIVEAVTGTNVDELTGLPGLGLAESALNAPAAEYQGVEFYPSIEKKAAVLCSRLVKNHPLPDGNKRSAFISLLEFLERNGLKWMPSDDDPNDSVAMIEAVAAGTKSEDDLERWIRSRLKQPDQSKEKLDR